MEKRELPCECCSERDCGVMAFRILPMDFSVDPLP
jgi:hypothetical protein